MDQKYRLKTGHVFTVAAAEDTCGRNKFGERNYRTRIHFKKSFKHCPLMQKHQALLFDIH